MTGLNDLTLFVVGALITIPAATVIIALVFAAGIDERAEKKRRADLMAGIKKNDRVCTIGGVLGTVVNVKDDEITLKVDESNNTKITFQRSAIARILHSDGAPAGDSSVTKK